MAGLYVSAGVMGGMSTRTLTPGIPARLRPSFGRNGVAFTDAIPHPVASLLPTQSNPFDPNETGLYDPNKPLGSNRKGVGISDTLSRPARSKKSGRLFRRRFRLRIFDRPLRLLDFIRSDSLTREVCQMADFSLLGSPPDASGTPPRRAFQAPYFAGQSRSGRVLKRPRSALPKQQS